MTQNLELTNNHLWWLNDQSTKILNNGYLLPNEDAEKAIHRVCDSAAKKYSHLGLYDYMYNNFKVLIMNGWISWSSPIWSNMGTERGLPISCFNVHIDDSVDDISDKLSEVIMQTKIGGGTSGYFGALRERGSLITNNGKSSGAVSFMKLFDTVADVISQGATRRGAFAAYLDVEHPDVEEFLQIKDIGSQIQNLFFGLSVGDDWMNSMIDGDKKKRDLWAKVLDSRKRKGLPYLFYRDNVNRNKPEIYKKLGLDINASNLCFTGDTIVAIADGTNGKTIKELAEMSNGKIKFPVYSGKERDSKIVGTRKGNNFKTSNWKPEIKQAVAFKSGTKKIIKVNLSNGDSFKCTPDHRIALLDGGYVEAQNSINEKISSFFTYTPLDRQTPYRHINSISNANSKQHLLIWNSLSNKDNIGHIDHIDNYIEYPDVLENLQTLTKEEHKIKTSNSIRGKNNWTYRVKDKVSKTINCSISTSGKNNPRYSGIDNASLINLCKEFIKNNEDITYEYAVNNIARTYNEFRKWCSNEYPELPSLPITFSKYRFNKDFKTFFEFVFIKEYNNEFEENRERVKHYSENEILDTNRKNYIKSNFYITENDNLIGLNGLTVTSIEDNGEVEDVYDLTVEDNHNFYIITSSEDENYLNCQGILVHNCAEIALPSTIDESFICCLSSMNLELFDEWKDTEAVKIAIYFLDAVLQEFIEKTENIKHLQNTRRFAMRHRALGLGVLGYHSYLQKNLYSFDSMEAKMFNARAFSHINQKSKEASKELGELLGFAPIFDEHEEITEKYRNTTRIAIAPTTSSSAILGQSSPGIEPYATNYYKAGLAKGNFMRKNKYLEALLESKKLNIDEVWDSIMLTGGSVQHLEYLDENEKNVFRTFREIAPIEIITQAAQRQQFIDQSQSLNLNIPNTVPVKDINALTIEAWKLGVKTLYYQRSNSVAKDAVVNMTVTCNSCEA